MVLEVTQQAVQIGNKIGPWFRLESNLSHHQLKLSAPMRQISLSRDKDHNKPRPQEQKTNHFESSQPWNRNTIKEKEKNYWLLIFLSLSIWKTHK
jgi:hypothetical protein